ncbi:MAG: hypothetical protein DCC56_08090 [Anaerolineae bacterium]|nr:MAG: hypothetical protein DCC56_08090 [Anaerolineae bacterium]WKZ45454.1 MAG: hypothetical protein QY302_06645 [Anaerolineales bacterium]
MADQTASKRSVRWTIIISILGAALLLVACIATLGSLYLDVAGEKTSGTLENVAKCSGSKTCFTAEISFTTNDGKTVSYKPALQNMFIYEMHRIANLNNNSGKSGNAVDVHYLASIPRLAKVSLNYHLEYVNLLVWFLWGGFVSLIGMALNRSKPLVLDFSKRK